jgi:hypothetical protein
MSRCLRSSCIQAQKQNAVLWSNHILSFSIMSYLIFSTGVEALLSPVVGHLARKSQVRLQDRLKTVRNRTQTLKCNCYRKPQSNAFAEAAQGWERSPPFSLQTERTHECSSQRTEDPWIAFGSTNLFMAESERFAKANVSLHVSVESLHSSKYKCLPCTARPTLNSKILT